MALQKEDYNEEGEEAHPRAVQHPTRGTNESWKRKVGAVGPVGLMIESILRTGSKISDDFVIHQPREQDVDILNVPFQYLTDLINCIGQRARTIADRSMKRTKLALIEIDVEATKRDTKLTEEDEAYLTTAMRTSPRLTIPRTCSATIAVNR